MVKDEVLGLPLIALLIQASLPPILMVDNLSVCRKPGHEAIDCYNRLNMAYQGRNPSRQLAAMQITAESPHVWLTDSGATHHH